MMFASKNIAMLLFTILLVFSNQLISKEGEALKFSFMPGERISYIQKLTAVKVKDMGEKGKQVDESTSSTKISMSKTETGWDVLVEPKNIVMKRNGEVVNNPIVTLLSSAIIIYKLDSDGNIIDIEGFEAFIEGLSKQVPPQVFEQITPILNIDALKAKEVAEWNGRIGDYIGAEVRIGDSFIAEVPFQLPNGSSISYNLQTNIAAIEPCAGKNCVRITQVYDSQADNVAKMSGEIVGNVSKAVAPTMDKLDSTNNSASISGTVKRLIDPNTMLIYEEKVTRIMNMLINAPGAGVIPIKMSETRLYEFQY